VADHRLAWNPQRRGDREDEHRRNDEEHLPETIAYRLDGFLPRAGRRARREQDDERCQEEPVAGERMISSGYHQTEHDATENEKRKARSYEDRKPPAEKPPSTGNVTTPTIIRKRRRRRSASPRPFF